MVLIKISQHSQEYEMDRARYSGLKQENLQMQMRCNMLPAHPDSLLEQNWGYHPQKCLSP